MFTQDEMASHEKETEGAQDLGSYIGAYQHSIQEATDKGKETPLTCTYKL